MLSPKEHLAYLVELAAEPGASERRELLRELGELLTTWPANYPIEARSSFAALLARVEHDVDPENRRALANKLARCPDAPLGLLNEFFFDVPADARVEILRRDSQISAPPDTTGIDEETIIQAARTKRGAEFASALATAFGIDQVTASEILQDGSGLGLAIACHGAGFSRAAYSTLAILTTRDEAQIEQRLAAFDAVPDRGGIAMLSFWRNQARVHAHAA